MKKFNEPLIEAVAVCAMLIVALLFATWCMRES